MAPLALAILLALTATSVRAAPCPVPAIDSDHAPVAFEDTHPACAAAKKLLPHFTKLRATARFTAEQLRLVVELGAEDGQENAYFWGGTVALNDAYLRLLPIESPAYLATLSHEIGHAVQQRDGVFEWHEAEERAGRGVSANMRLESHADAIGLQLLVDSQYPADTFIRGREQRFSCAAIQETPGEPGSDETHSANRHRWGIGVALGSMMSAKSREELARLSGATAAAVDTAFTGAAPRREAPVAPARAPTPAVAAGAFKPRLKITDFDPRGRVLPGRLASSDLRLEPPGPDASALRENAWFFANVYASRLADGVQAAVDWWHTRESLSDLAARGCGRVVSEDGFTGAVVSGVTDWARQAAERTARWLRGEAAPAARK